MTFNPQDHMSKLRGGDYLEVKWRLMWFRDVHPIETGWALGTEIMSVDPVIVKATITNPDGLPIATGHGSAQANSKAVWSGREIEKAETAAIGRALAHAGFGTQFTDEDEGDNIVDSPVERGSPTPPKTAKKGPNSAFSKKQDATPTQSDNGAEIKSGGDAPEQLFDMANMAAFQKWAKDKLDVSTKDIADAMVMTFGKPLADVAPTLTKSQMIGAIIAWACSYDVDVLEAGYIDWPDSVYEAAFGYVLQHKVKNAAEIGF